MIVIELTSTTEVFYSRSNTATGDISGTPPIDVSVNQVRDINDADSFTNTSNTQKNIEKANDFFFFGNARAASNDVGSGSRYTGMGTFTLNGTEIAEIENNDYMRNNQGSADLFSWSINIYAALRLSVDDKIGLSVSMLSGSEGGGNPVIKADWASYGAINLDTTEAAGGGGSEHSHHHHAMMH